MKHFKAMASKEVNIIEEEKEEERESNHRPRRQRVDGILPQRLTFVSKATFKTPKKNIVKALDNGLLDEDVRKRWENCPGFPLPVYRKEKEDKDGPKGEDNRRACAICGTKARFYCIGCRSFFCMEGKATKTRKACLFHLPTENEDGTRGEDKIFQKSCYHQKHHEAYERMVRMNEAFDLMNE